MAKIKNHSRFENIEPHLMTILSKKFEMITRDMTQTLLKSARSGVIAVSEDFSSGITTFDGRQFMIDAGAPIHLGHVQATPEITKNYFDDISPGDCYLTNSPYHGNTHHADYTIYTPVFYEGEPLFWSINRAHQADVGAPEPTTYNVDAETVYEEGTHFPCVRIQEDYEDRDDIVRLCKHNIRAGDRQWYGDYRAQVGSVRAGEEEIINLCDEYGVETIKAFVEEWMAYGERMMSEEISELPDENIERTTYHDPIPGISSESIPVNIKLDIDPNDSVIHVDLTENIDNIPAGFNLTVATTVAPVYASIFYNLKSEVPHNHGSISCIEIEYDKGKIVGEPEYPAGTGAATVQIACCLGNAVQAAFGELGEPYGMSEVNAGIWPDEAVISGTDFRKENSPYINQIFLTDAGTPALYGHDAWLGAFSTYSSGGLISRDSVEVDEEKYPILVEKHEFEPDTGGAGKWRGGPRSITEFGPRKDSMKIAYIGTGEQNPPRGILGGNEGAAGCVFKKSKSDGSTEKLPSIIYESMELQPDETVLVKPPGGGGYGNPLERDLEDVKNDIKLGLVSVEGARKEYGVVVRKKNDSVVVNEDETEQLRTQMMEDE